MSQKGPLSIFTIFKLIQSFFGTKKIEKFFFQKVVIFMLPVGENVVSESYAYHLGYFSALRK